MATYVVEIDGKRYRIQGDRPPSEGEARAAVGAFRSSATPPPAEATAGMLPPSTIAGGDPEIKSPLNAVGIRIVPNAQWAQMTPAAKAQGLLKAAGYGLGSAFFGPEQAKQMTDNPGSTLASAALTAGLAKAPAILERTRGAASGLIDKGARALGMSRSHAGEVLDQVRAATAEIPVADASGTLQSTLSRAAELKAAGGQRPDAVLRLTKRLADPAAGDLTWREAEDFASNLSRLSANEFNRLNPAMQRQVTLIRNALRDALTSTADTVGQGAQYQAGIREYAKAAKAGEAWQSVAPGLKKTLLRAMEGAGFSGGAIGAYKALSDR